MNFEEEAKKYLEIGWVPIPLIPRDKKPLLKEWKPYQDRKPSVQEIQKWSRKWPDANIGIVTGEISNIVVFDEDGPEAEEFAKKQGGFPVTPRSRTAAAFHDILKHPGFKVSNSSNKKLLLDVRGDGGYIVVPPSIHPSGHQYQWIISPFDTDPAPLRPWMIQYLKDHFHEEVERLEIKAAPGGWDKAKRVISNHPRIMLHLMTPKPEDRSGHDWRLACLCVEERITDPGLLYQIILNNPCGKAQAYSRTDKYLEDLISRCLGQFQIESKENRFPKDAIQGLAREYADIFSEYLEPPWSFFAHAFLTYLGNLLADRLTLASAIGPQPRMFTVILGESADDRKSECIKQTISFFSETMNLFSVTQDFNVCLGVGSAEGLAERLKKYPKTLLVYDEFKTFVSKAMIETSVLLQCVNSLFENTRFHSHVKGHSIEVDSGYLSILGASTIDTYQRMWTPAFTDIGFINRLWLVPDHGERRFSIPSPIPESIKKDLREKLLSLLNAVPKTQTFLEITPEAFEVFNRWYLQTPQSIFTKRLDTYGHRLMILFCGNENKTKVTPDIAERVVRLLEWQRRVREENDVIDAEGKIARMEEAIRRALKKNHQGVARRELQRVTNYNRGGIFVWNTAVNNLLQEEIVFDSRRQIYRFKDGGF